MQIKILQIKTFNFSNHDNYDDPIEIYNSVISKESDWIEVTKEEYITLSDYINFLCKSEPASFYNNTDKYVILVKPEKTEIEQLFENAQQFAQEQKVKLKERKKQQEEKEKLLAEKQKKKEDQKKKKKEEKEKRLLQELSKKYSK
jgi:hypothetical protein